MYEYMNMKVWNTQLSWNIQLRMADRPINIVKEV